MRIEDLFVGWYDYSNDDFETVMKNAMISLDTNVLLNIYRYSKETSDKTLYFLNKISNRLIFSYYVALEFTKNRKKVESDSIEEYRKNQQKIATKYDDIINELNSISNNKMADKEKIVTSIEKNKEKVLKKFEDSIIKKTNVFKSGLEKEICRLFDERIIDKFPEKEFECIKAEGIRRQKEQIPPGYKDEEKGENGDYYIFKQLIDYSKMNNKDIIFVTDDIKEDMFQKIGGIKSPRPELLNEFYKETGHKLIMLTVQEFLNNKIIFNEDISEKVLDEIKVISNEYHYVGIKAHMRIRKFMYRAFKYGSLEEIEDNSISIEKALRTIIRITEGLNDKESLSEYNYLISLLEDDNYSQFKNDSQNYTNKILSLKNKEKKRIEIYKSNINNNSTTDEFINYIEVLINYIDIFMNESEDFKSVIIKLRDLKRSINNNFIPCDKILNELEDVYEKLFGGETKC